MTIYKKGGIICVFSVMILAILTFCFDDFISYHGAKIWISITAIFFAICCVLDFIVPEKPNVRF